MKANNIRALVMTGFGLNCDIETAHSLDMSGAKAERIHLNQIYENIRMIHDYQILVFGGGFSWGDDHGAGHIQGRRTKRKLGDELPKFIDSDKLVLGICNGFQTLVNMALVPGFDGDYNTQSVALTYNDCGNFRDQWVGLRINQDSDCVFTRGLEYLELPIRHGEGKFYAEQETLERLMADDQHVMMYARTDSRVLAGGAYSANPNGSLHDIAGVCDGSGRIFGLMPHPEAFNHVVNHPQFTRFRYMADKQGRRVEELMPPLGLKIFENAVEYFR